MERNFEIAASTSVISWNMGSCRLPIRVPQFNVRARDNDSRSIMGMQSTPTVPARQDSNASLTNSLVSRSRCETYVAMDGLLSAEAAPFRRRLSESLNGDVPIVVPAVLERTCISVSRCPLSPSHSQPVSRCQHKVIGPPCETSKTPAWSSMPGCSRRRSSSLHPRCSLQ